jgi:hypothetical protein
MRDLLFVSYSRVQINYARSLVMALQSRGLNIWFDLQELLPGIKWEAGIRQGLDECHALILIASEAAFASVYVQQEWESALANHKPVYVVYYEPVHLPQKLLQSAYRFDLTSDFDAGVSRLVDCIVDHICQFDRAPTQGLFKVPYRLPREVKSVANILTVVGLSIGLPLVGILSGIHPPTQQWMLEQQWFPTTAALLTCWFLWSRWCFVRHQLPYTLLRLCFYFVDAAVVLSVLLLIFTLVLSSYIAPVWLVWHIILSFGLSWAFWRLHHKNQQSLELSDPIQRWLPKTFATEGPLQPAEKNLLLYDILQVAQKSFISCTVRLKIRPLPNRFIRPFIIMDT